MNQVYGIEVHEILARICKINLLLHHDGHTNIEANRSVLDTSFTNPRLNPPQCRFSVVVGNPPFGTDVEQGDDEQLGQNQLDSFVVAAGMRKVDSEQVILERCVDLLEPGGRLGLILPDGLLNNQGNRSNCPRTRSFVATRGQITAIVSLPDHAFRKSGAQNKTSILFFRKFNRSEQRRFDTQHNRLIRQGNDADVAIGAALREAGIDYWTFLGEANNVGYTTVDVGTDANDLYSSAENDALATIQTGTILGEWNRFLANPDSYDGLRSPDCASFRFDELWNAHGSHRLDPKYHLFKLEAGHHVPCVHVSRGLVRSGRANSFSLAIWLTSFDRLASASFWAPSTFSMYSIRATAGLALHQHELPAGLVMRRSWDRAPGPSGLMHLSVRPTPLRGGDAHPRVAPTLDRNAGHGPTEVIRAAVRCL